jgi:hypothetical protein
MITALLVKFQTFRVYFSQFFYNFHIVKADADSCFGLSSINYHNRIQQLEIIYKISDKALMSILDCSSVPMVIRK